MSSPLGTQPVVINDGGDLEVLGIGRISAQKHYPLSGSERTLRAADLDSLAKAIREEDRYQSKLPDAIQIVREDDYDEYTYEPEDVWIEVDETSVCGVFEILVRSGNRRTNTQYEELVRLPLDAVGAQLTQLEYVNWDGSLESEMDWVDWDDPEARQAALAEARTLRGKVTADSVAGIISGARIARSLIDQLASGPMTVSAAVQMVRARVPEAIIGLSESSWLEVKSAAYDLQAPELTAARQRFEFAQDIARFANGDVDAVLLIGFRTKLHASRGETVSALCPLKGSSVKIEQYEKIADQYVFPHIEGLTIQVVAIADNDDAILVVEVPRQPEQLKPFLVHGAVIGDRVDRSFISIVRRRDSHSIVTVASQIHAQIAAGERFSGAITRSRNPCQLLRTERQSVGAAHQLTS